MLNWFLSCHNSVLMLCLGLGKKKKKHFGVGLVWFGLEKIMSILVATITDGPKMAGIGHHKNSLN